MNDLVTVVAVREGIRPCKAHEIFEDPAAEELFAEYSKECANPLLGSTCPQSRLYGMLEERSMAQCFGAYHEGKLIGFAFVMVSPLTHYEGKFATVESLFLSRRAYGSAATSLGTEYRSAAAGLGTELMQCVESYAKQLGCQAIFYSAPIKSRLARLLFLLPEYYHTNHVFTRKLG